MTTLITNPPALIPAEGDRAECLNHLPELVHRSERAEWVMAQIRLDAPHCDATIAPLYLRRTAAVLERPLPEGMTFDLSAWLVTMPDCSTAACAIGSAIKAGAAPAGLHLTPQTPNQGSWIPEFADPDGDGAFWNFQAVALAYGLTEEVAEFLFAPDAYEADEETDPFAVAARLREAASVIEAPRYALT